MKEANKNSKEFKQLLKIIINKYLMNKAFRYRITKVRKVRLDILKLSGVSDY